MLIGGLLSVFFERLFVKQGISAAEKVPGYLSRRLAAYLSAKEKRFNREASSTIARLLPSELKAQLIRITDDKREEYVPFLVLPGKEEPELVFNSNRWKRSTESEGPIIKLLTSTGRRIYDGDIIRVLSSRDGKLEVGPGSYFETLESTDRFYYSIGVRNLYKSTTSHPVLDDWSIALNDAARGSFGNLHAALGISVCIARRTGPRTWNLYYKHRSRNTATGTFQYHVVPSFMASPFVGMTGEDYDSGYLKLQMAKEYMEELESAVEFEEDHMSKDRFRHLLSEKKSKTAERIIEEYDGVTFLGVGVDIFRMRPELIYLLEIDEEPDFWIGKSWETRRVDNVRIGSGMSDSDVRKNLGSHWQDMCPPGKAALLMAARHLVGKE